MKHRIITATLLIFFVALTSCATLQPEPTPAPLATPAPMANMPNPASVYCEQHGNKLEIRTAADGSQSGVCIFPEGSECDEWSYFRGECSPANQNTATSAPTVEPTATTKAEIPAALLIDPADYQGWWTYTHAVYGFSIMLPEDWVVDETTTFDPLMKDHWVILRPEKEVENFSIRMSFRKTGEETPLWPTGVGQGEFVPQGTLDIAGQPAKRIYFVCPNGQVNSIWYHGSDTEANIRRGDLEFGFIYRYNDPIYCSEGYSLSGKIQRVGEMIIASLKVP